MTGEAGWGGSLQEGLLLERRAGRRGVLLLGHKFAPGTGAESNDELIWCHRVADVNFATNRNDFDAASVINATLGLAPTCAMQVRSGQ